MDLFGFFAFHRIMEIANWLLVQREQEVLVLLYIFSLFRYTIEKEVLSLETYIALLRGINVGGKNKISMPALKAAFEAIGFFDVRTYINSGNVIFSTNIQDERELSKKSKAIVLDTFMLDIPIMVISAKALKQTLEHAPEWWGTVNKEVYDNAIFVIAPARVEDVFETIGDAHMEYERISHYGNVIFWSASLAAFSKTKYSKIASSSVNQKVTIRNANTIKKLLSKII